MTVAERVRGAADASYRSLKGKRVLITGGSSGIGKATALAFDANGAIVTITGRRKERLEAVTKQMKQGHVVIADLLREEDCPRTIEEAVKLMGGLDILVNSGGVWTDPMLKDHMSPAAFNDAFTMHVITVTSLINLAMPHLSKSKAGAVVNLSSLSAFQVNPDGVSYNVCKAAQDHLTRTLARKYTKDGVRINSVNPGYVKTEVFDVMAKELGKPVDEILEWSKAENEFHEVCLPEEVAAPILFLASDAASFISGIHLPVDGCAQIALELGGL